MNGQRGCFRLKRSVDCVLKRELYLGFRVIFEKPENNFALELIINAVIFFFFGFVHKPLNLNLSALHRREQIFASTFVSSYNGRLNLIISFINASFVRDNWGQV